MISEWYNLKFRRARLPEQSGLTGCPAPIHAYRRRPVSGTIIESQVDAKSAEFQKNSRQMVDRLTEIKDEEERIRQGGGSKAIDAQHKKGRLTARERIAKLIDPKTEFFELGLYAA